MLGEIGWCDKCNVPIMDAGTCGICSSQSRNLPVGRGNLKPIFQPEKKFCNEIINQSLKISYNLISSNLCFRSSGWIVVDGQKVFRIFLEKKNLTWKASPSKKYKFEDLEGSDLKTVIKANRHILRKKEKEATNFLKKTFERYDLPAIVSVSGGKDSSCALYLTRKVKRNISALYLNTTLDFPETVDYLHTLRKKWRLNLIEIFPEHAFLDLCKELGPPSAFMPWCCQTQKFAPFNKYLNENFPKGVLSVEGLRRFESQKRMDYKRVSANRAIHRKKSVCPILDWTTLDVWLYTLWKKIPINPMYEFGYDRIGCWACPHRPLTLFKLSEKTHPKLIKIWHDFLLNYASHNGKDDEWVYRGHWRVRREAYVKTPLYSRKPCNTDNSLVYEINDALTLNRVKEFMKIFGKVIESKRLSNVRLIRGQDVQISIIGPNVRVSFQDKGKLRKLEKQLSRAINCVSCGACIGACEALRIKDDAISIDENKCTHCLRCVSGKYLRMSCVALNYKKERRVWSVGEPKSTVD